MLRKTDTRPPLEGSYVVPVLVEADERLSKVSAENPSLHIELSHIAELLSQANNSLRSMPGVRLLVSDSSVREKCREKIKSIKLKIRKNCSPKHVPSLVVKVPAIPRTKSGKIVELAVKKIIHGETINNKEAIANPEALEYFKNLPQLK